MLQSKYVKVNNKSNLMQIAYDTLKSDICNNVIKPGELLSENVIAKELNMSRTPVREALRVLANEDYVEIIKGVGAFVKSMSIDDIKDIYEIRRSLELLAAKTAINNITEDEIDDLEKRFTILKEIKYVKNVKFDEFSKLDWEFHELLIERCTNNYIKNIMKDINANIKRYQYASFEALHDVEESVSQHLSLLDLMRQKDTDRLLIELDKHLLWSYNCFKKQILK